MNLQIFLLLGATFLAAADPKEAIERDFKKLQGKWQFVSITSDGKELPKEAMREASLTIEDKRFVLRMNGQTHTGIINLNPAVNPKTMDITYNSGPEKGKKALGIYDVRPGSLKVCMGIVGADRPTTFASKPRSGHVLEVLVQQKP